MAVNNNNFDVAYLKCVPQFNGDSNELHRFLRISDQIIETYYDRVNQNNFRNVYLLNSLLNKLEGNAKVVVNINKVDNWDELRNVLIRNFSDRRDEACLNRDLSNLKQKFNETANQFYDRCLHLLTIICSYVKIHEVNQNDIDLKRELYNKLTLKTFLAGLRDPLGTTVRTMKPVDLAEAISFVNEEENIKYMQQQGSQNYSKIT